MALQTASKAKQAAPPPQAAVKKRAKPAPAPAKQVAASPPKAAKPATAAARKAAPKAAAPRKADTVTLKSVFEHLAVGFELPRKTAHAMASGLVDRVTAILKGGDRVRMSGLGILAVTDRPARMGRNPATGAAVQIAASRKVTFRVSKELKEAV